VNPTLQGAVCAARPKTLTDTIQVTSENKSVHFIKKDVLCRNCNKKGHYASECRTKMKRQPQNRGNTKLKLTLEDFRKIAVAICEVFPTLSPDVFSTANMENCAIK
jgi:Zinc knuckle